MVEKTTLNTVIKDVSNDLSNSLKYLHRSFIKLFDIYFNHNLNKLLNYRVYIGLTITILFVLFYVFINEIGLNERNRLVVIFLMFSIFSVIFIYIIYRNEDSIVFDINRRRLIREENKAKFHKVNFVETIVTPILKLIFSLLGYLLLVILLFFIIGLFFWSMNNSAVIFKILELSLGLLSLIIILSIIAKLFSINLENCNLDKFNDMGIISRLFCLIKKLIFFIPCLFLIFIINLKEELRLTPPVVFILLILEIILILMLIALPSLYKVITNLNGNNLLPDGPVYLNNKKTIGKYQKLNKQIKDDNIQIYSLINPFNESQSLKYQFGNKNMDLENYNYSYSIKFNLYINPQDNNTSVAYNKETNLLNYGNKPQILYDGRTKEIIIRTQTKKNDGNKYELVYKTNDFKYQKWIPFIINYSNNKIDIFINNKLVATKDNIPPYFTDDEVIIGENNGIHGSINEIYYYDKIQTTDLYESFFKINHKNNNNNFGNTSHDYKYIKNNIKI